VILTEAMAESVASADQFLRYVLRFSAAAFIVLALVPPYLSHIFVRRLNWRSRQKYEYIFVSFLLLAIVSLILFPVTLIIEYAIDITWGRLVFQTLDDLSVAGDSAFFWSIAAVCVGTLFIAGKASQNLAKTRNRIFLYLTAAVGPGLIFLIYALLCVWQIDSPYIHLEARYFLSQSEVDELTQNNFPDSLRAEMTGEDQPLGTAISFTQTSKGEKWTVTDETHSYEMSLADRVLSVRNSWLEKGLDAGKLTPGIRDLLDQKGIEPSMENGQEIKIVKKGEEDVGWSVKDKAGQTYTIARPFKQKLALNPTPRDLWDGVEDYALYGGAFLVLLLNWIFVNVNFTSLHGFYRDQLTRGFLFEASEQGRYESGKLVKMSALNRPGSAAPYHLVNVPLNLQGSDDANLRGRDADFFLISRHWTGGERTGYVRTEDMESADGHLDLGTAIAISGAAASPNAGAVAIRPLVFVLTMLNLRLDYWLPNPSYVRTGGMLRKLVLRRGAGAGYVYREAIGSLNDKGSFVNLSDGGHLENMGIYQLLRRRCSTIICVDGEADPDLTFGGLVKLIRFAAIDLGIDIKIDLSGLRRQSNGLSRAHYAIGEIDYGQENKGTLYYVKSTLTGDENPYIAEYAARNPGFPHESTADQFFSEEQFEAYRALGNKMGHNLLKENPQLAS
jgi:hypothetical protein